MRNTDQLTITRFAAALTVVFFHYAQNVYPLNVYPLNKLLLTGHIFVNYFFALSGFIMVMVYHKPEVKFDKTKYWLYRIARIYPIYVFALILTIGQNLDFLRGLRTLAYNFTLLQAWIPPYPATLNYPGWSLSVEAFFYLLFPFLIEWIYRQPYRRAFLFIAGFWLGSQVLHSVMLTYFYTGFPSISHDILFYNPVLHLNTFLLGCLGGLWFVKKSEHVRIRPAGNLLIIFGCLAAIGLCLVYAEELPVILGLNIDFVLTNGLLAPLFVIFIISLALDNTLLARVLRQPWLVLLGDASYSLYILQYPVNTFYKKIIEPLFLRYSNGVNFLLYLVLLIVFSILVFKLLEHPARITVKRAYDKFKARRTAAVQSK